MKTKYLRFARKLLSKILPFLASFLMVFQTFAPSAIVLAQEVASPTPTEDPSPAPSPQISESPNIESSPSPQQEQSPEPSAPPEVSPQPEESTSPSPQPSEIQTDKNEPTEEQKDNQSPSPGSQSPSPSPSLQPEATKGDEHLDVNLVSGTKTLSPQDIFGQSYSEPSAYLSTDKSDYSPTESAVVTGSGFTSNTTYTLVVSSQDPPAVNSETSVTTNDQGTFTYTYQLDGNYRPNYKVEVKDSTGTVLATTTFTDSIAIFSDGFESDDFSSWTGSGTWGIVGTGHTGSKSAKVVGGTSGDTNLQKNQSTVGYENITLTFWYKVQKNLEGEDHLKVEYSIDGGSNWTELTDYTNDNANDWTEEIFNLPSSANNISNFEFRFKANLSSGSDEFRVDDVSLTGDTADTTAPTVLNVSATDANGTYYTNETVHVTVQFSEPVTVTPYYWFTCTFWGFCPDHYEYPKLQLQLDGQTRWLAYTSGSGTDTLQFDYVVADGDSSDAINYVNTESLIYNSRDTSQVTIRDAAGNAADITLPAIDSAESLDGQKDIAINRTSTARLRAFKYFDADQNGSYDGDDYPLEGWRISLYNDRGFTYISDKATGADGYTEYWEDVPVEDPNELVLQEDPSVQWGGEGWETRDGYEDWQAINPADRGGGGSGTYWDGEVVVEADGTHTFSFGNWKDSVTDTTPPVSSFSSPSSYTTYNSPISISGSSTDVPDTTVAQVNIYARPSGEIDWGDPIMNFEGNGDDPFNWSSDWTPEQDGTYDLKVSAIDDSGNVEESDYVYEIMYDATPPESSIDYPTEEETYTEESWSEDGQIRGSATDNSSGVSTVYVAIQRDSDGAYWCDWNECPESGGWYDESEGETLNEVSDFDLESWYYEEIDTSDLLPESGTEGYTLTSHAEDYAGNREETSQVHFYISASDNTPPTVESAKTQDTNGNGKIDAILLTFSEDIDDLRLDPGTSDGWDIEGYDDEAIQTGEGENDNKLLLQFSEGETADTGATPTVSYSSCWIFCWLPNSTHDLAGNELESNSWGTIDGAAPISSISYPAEGVSYAESEWDGEIRGTAKDEPAEVNSLWVSIKRDLDDKYWDGVDDEDGVGWRASEEEYLNQSTLGEDGNWSFDFDYIEPEGGDEGYTVRSHAVDSAENQENTAQVHFFFSHGAPIISSEGTVNVGSAQVTFVWTTNIPATSRVLYDTVSHSDLGDTPNYGYANSTGESDTDPKVTTHTVIVCCFNQSTTYYYRTVSQGSPESASAEHSFTTMATPPQSINPNSQQSSSTSTSTSTTSTTPAAGTVAGTIAQLGQGLGVSTGEEVLGEATEEATPLASPSPPSQILGTESQEQSTSQTNKSKWLIILLVVVFGVGILYLLFGRRLKKDKTPQL